MLLPTSLVGSYPQPEWLIDRVKLSKQVPRVRADDLWLVAPDKLEAAQDDATPELEGCKAQQISIEAAQPKLDLKVLKELPSKTIIFGVIDLADMTFESPQIVAGRIRHALAYVPAERTVVAPDCGMKYLPRAIAFGKMQAMAQGAAIVRRELAGA